MFEDLLSDAFSVCFGKYTEPEILLFKRFQKIGLSSTTMNQKKQSISIITASDDLKTFISDQQKIATKLHRNDYRVLLISRQ